MWWITAITTQIFFIYLHCCLDRSTIILFHFQFAQILSRGHHSGSVWINVAMKKGQTSKWEQNENISLHNFLFFPFFYSKCMVVVNIKHEKKRNPCSMSETAKVRERIPYKVYKFDLRFKEGNFPQTPLLSWLPGNCAETDVPSTQSLWTVVVITNFLSIIIFHDEIDKHGTVSAVCFKLS